MSLELVVATQNDANVWNQVVNSSKHGNIFHTWEWLSALSRFLNIHFEPLIVYKNENPLAIYPFFIMKKGFFTFALSPPIGGILNYLGPVIKDYDTMRLEKKTSVYLEVQKEIDEYLFSTKKCSLIRIRSAPDLLDPRPLRWNGYQLDPFFTYRINLKEGADTIFQSFDKKLRYGITKTEKDGVTVEDGNIDDLLFVFEKVNTRFIEQGYSTHDYAAYIRDIFGSLYPQNMKIFIARYNDEKISGMIVPYFKNIAYIWHGIPKSSIPGISPNDLLIWEAIKWADQTGLDYLENIDAGVDIRLSRFKAKFNPELTPWYSALKYRSTAYRFGGSFVSYIRKRPIH